MGMEVLFYHDVVSIYNSISEYSYFQLCFLFQILKFPNSLLPGWRNRSKKYSQKIIYWEITTLPVVIY